MTEPTVHDLSPTTHEFLDAVMAGLETSPKMLPCKYLYDETGAQIFEAICTLDTYYPTRTERGILDRHADEMAQHIGPNARVIEPGSGSLDKIRILLEHLDQPSEFVPIDISMEQLESAAADLARSFPDLAVTPVCADFTRPMELPAKTEGAERSVVFYPGSTIGNFEPEAARIFLERMAALAGEDGLILVGADLAKDEQVLHDAYDDPAGLTAAFNKNLLWHMNRELGADFDLKQFEHRVRIERDPNRVVLTLVSTADQTVTLGGQSFSFAAGEEMVTEYSHKPTVEDFAKTAASAGLKVRQFWTDENGWFSVQLLELA